MTVVVKADGTKFAPVKGREIVARPADIYERALRQILYIGANAIDYRQTLLHMRFLAKQALVNGAGHSTETKPGV